MTDKTLKSQAFKLKGRLFTFTVVYMLETDPYLIDQQLSEVVTQAPRLFDHTPVVIDCSAINCDKLDLQTTCQCMRAYGLIPVALQGGNPFLNTLAQCQGLAILNASASHDRVVSERETVVTETIKSKLVIHPVRSGQQVVSKGSDLVILASVSHGAELLADGNIHIYGALRGRALAGISGDQEARIFCQSLDAELVSIAGYYRLSDAITPIDSPCQIFLQDDHIQIEPL